MQNKKRIVVANPRMPVANALVRIPLLAMTLREEVKTMSNDYTLRCEPGMARFFCDMTRCVETSHDGHCKQTRWVR